MAEPSVHGRIHSVFRSTLPARPFTQVSGQILEDAPPASNSDRRLDGRIRVVALEFEVFQFVIEN